MGQKVLVIDDSDPIHELVKFRLKNDPIEVLCARDGVSGIGLSAHAEPDLILLDVDMPGIDGFEVCRRLKADPATSNIPVLFLTSVSKVENKVRGLALGADDYVTKPFDSTELRARIQSSLRNSRRRDLMTSRIMIDDLTGLWNEVYFKCRLEGETAEARRHNHPLACILVDVDHLGAINARFGIEAGNDVLRTLSERLLEISRTEDTVSHLQGGTFAVLCPNITGRQAVRFASRLWLSVQARPIIRGENMINFKCSYGVGCFHPDHPEVLEEARHALLTAKNFGGTRVAAAQHSEQTTGTPASERPIYQEN